MIVRPDERVPIARLLAFLAHGERLAHDCAKAQASLVESQVDQRFLLSQSRQEAMHARVFQGAIVWLAPKHMGDCPLLPPLEAYRGRLMQAVNRGQVVETILAEQVILEGVGEALLTRIEAGLLKRAAPFRRLRQILLLQEEAHAGFGRRYLDRAIASGRTSTDALRADAQEYLELAMAMVTTLGDLFGDLQEDATAWASDISHFVPAWLQSEASPQTPRTVAP